MKSLSVKNLWVVCLLVLLTSCGGSSKKSDNQSSKEETKISKGNIELSDLPVGGTVGFVLVKDKYYYFLKPGAVTTSINHVHNGKAYGSYTTSSGGNFFGFELDLKTNQFTEIAAPGNRFFIVRGGFENKLLGKLADEMGTVDITTDDVRKGYVYDTQTKEISAYVREGYSDIGFTSMNKSGVITGFNDFGTQGLLFVDGKYINLNHSDAYRLFPFQINNKGKFVGFWGSSEATWYENDNPSFVGYFSNNQYTVEKYELPGFVGVGLAGVNDSGEISGIAYKDKDSYPQIFWAKDESSIPKFYPLPSHVEPFVTGMTADGAIYGQLFVYEKTEETNVSETVADKLLKDSELILDTVKKMNGVAHSGSISGIIHSAFHEFESPAVGLKNRAAELVDIFGMADKKFEIQTYLTDNLWIRLRKIEAAANSIRSLVNNSEVSTSNDAITALQIIEEIVPYIEIMRERIISVVDGYQNKTYDHIENLDGCLNPQQLTNGNILAALSTDNRVVELSFDGNVMWSYNIGYPTIARRLNNGHTLIASRTEEKVFEIDENKTIVWEYSGKYIYGAERLENGNTLLAIQGGDPYQIVEVNQAGAVVWKYEGTLVAPSFKKLKNGNVLIADNSGYSIGKAKVFEITTAGEIVWEYEENIYGIYGVDRLDNGNTLINDQGNGRIIEVDSSKKIVWSFGALSLPGGFDVLENGDLLVGVFGENRLFVITKE